MSRACKFIIADSAGLNNLELEPEPNGNSPTTPLVAGSGEPMDLSSLVDLVPSLRLERRRKRQVAVASLAVEENWASIKQVASRVINEYRAPLDLPDMNSTSVDPSVSESNEYDASRAAESGVGSSISPSLPPTASTTVTSGEVTQLCLNHALSAGSASQQLDCLQFLAGNRLCPAYPVCDKVFRWHGKVDYENYYDHIEECSHCCYEDLAISAYMTMYESLPVSRKHSKYRTAIMAIAAQVTALYRSTISSI